MLKHKNHRIPGRKAHGWSVVLLSLALVCLGSARGAAQALTTFLPSSAESSHGRVSRANYETGLIDVGAGYIAHSPAGSTRLFHFEEPVWVIGYETSIHDAEGREPKENYLCHTFLGDQEFTQHDNPKMNAIYSDAFTRSVRLPEGFGLYLPENQPLSWLPLFNNRTDASARVKMRVEITLIREKDLVKSLRRVYSTLRSAKMPHLFFVPPKRHKQEAVFSFPFAARIHFMGTHVHPYAELMELYNQTKNEQVWKGRSRWRDSGEMVGFDVYSSVEGYRIEPTDKFRLTSTYNNTTDHEIDAMAGLFLFYSMD